MTDQLNASLLRSNDEISRSIDAALQWLIREQEPDGSWVGMVETNSAIEAEWLLASHILGISLPDEAGLIRTLRKRQRPDGAWEIYPGAPAGDINSTIEVYAALRAKGVSATDPTLTKARAWILEHHGLKNVRVFTRYWLAMIGVWDWKGTPNLPAEIMFLPKWFPFNIYNFAQWARATMVPLAVLCARRPVWPLPDGSRLEELFVEGIDLFDFKKPPKKPRPFSLESMFQLIDKALHKLQDLKLLPLRELSIKVALEWMLKHQDSDGAWGGIQPPWIYGLLALRNEGYALDHPVIVAGLKALDLHWSYDRDGTKHIQASESPVWDTLFSVLALNEAGCMPSKSPDMCQAIDWVLDHQVLQRGDWEVHVKNVRPGGWAFERANLHYPDVDDTALALLVLAKVSPDCDHLRQDRIKKALDLGVEWTFAMQSTNGGWAAFDRDNNREIISKIPFCNFGEALDPPSVDVTGHVLEALGALGFSRADPRVAKAIRFIRDEQEVDGSWFGRWGVNYIYGTGAVLPGLAAIGEDMSADYIQKAINWIVDRQNPDGGWGESCASYMSAAYRGVGESTPSQTAWALMSILSSPEHDVNQSKSYLAGCQYLLDSQLVSGTWDEKVYTATGFPGYGSGSRVRLDDPDLEERLQQGVELSRGFMISFNMYRHYFPIIALSRAHCQLAALSRHSAAIDANIRLAAGAR